MPAYITVETGLTAGTQYWIEKNVTRIGSGSNTEICLPSSEVPSHAVTLEFFDGEYRAYNRTRRSFTIGNNEILPGESSIFDDGQSIVLPDGTRLAIEIDEDPTPASRPAGCDDDDFEVDEVTIIEREEETGPRSRKKANPQTISQLLILVVCSIGCYFLLSSDGSSTGAVQSGFRFDVIVEAALKDEKASKPVLKKLQFAQAALIRNDKEVALYFFSELRSQLIAQKPQFVSENRKVELAILNYVQNQVRQLQ